MVKEKKLPSMTVIGQDPKSAIAKFREKYLKKKIELIDITQLCEFKLGRSGSCNEINEPNEEIYHIQCLYRGDNIANFNGDSCAVLDDKQYVIFITNTDDPNGSDFIIFRLCPVE